MGPRALRSWGIELEIPGSVSCTRGRAGLAFLPRRAGDQPQLRETGPLQFSSQTPPQEPAWAENLISSLTCWLLGLPLQASTCSGQEIRSGRRRPVRPARLRSLLHPGCLGC